MVTAAEQAREYAELASTRICDAGARMAPVQAIATLASTYATLALVEELGRFHAVAVETSDA